MKLVTIFAVAAVASVGSACDYSGTQVHISGCVGTFTGGINCMTTSGFSCICPLFTQYFQCLSETPCLDSSSRNAIASIANSYSSMLTSYCAGEVVIPVYRTRLYIAKSYFGLGYTFSAAQYQYNCESIFNSLGYTSSEYKSWCLIWTDYIKYVWGSRRRSEYAQIEVTVPQGTFVPPVSQIDTIDLLYNDGNGSSVQINADVADVEPIAQESSSNSGSSVMPNNVQTTPYVYGNFPTPPPTNAASDLASTGLVFVLASVAVLLFAF